MCRLSSMLENCMCMYVPYNRDLLIQACTCMHTSLHKSCQDDKNANKYVHTYIWMYVPAQSVSHNCFYYTSKPECVIPDDNTCTQQVYESQHSVPFTKKTGWCPQHWSKIFIPGNYLTSIKLDLAGSCIRIQNGAYVYACMILPSRSWHCYHMRGMIERTIIWTDRRLFGTLDRNP
jgi:hypothetical protein